MLMSRDVASVFRVKKSVSITDMYNIIDPEDRQLLL